MWIRVFLSLKFQVILIQVFITILFGRIGTRIINNLLMYVMGHGKSKGLALSQRTQLPVDNTPAWWRKTCAPQSTVYKPIPPLAKPPRYHLPVVLVRYWLLTDSQSYHSVCQSASQPVSPRESVSHTYIIQSVSQSERVSQSVLLVSQFVSQSCQSFGLSGRQPFSQSVSHLVSQPITVSQPVIS